MWQDKAQLARYFSLAMGVGFLAAGVTGFIPGLTQPVPASAPELIFSLSYGRLWGLFPINALHNVYHLFLAVYGLLGFRSFAAARSFNRFFGISLTVLTIMGLIPALNTGFGFFPLYGNDIWLHGIEAVLGLYFGFFVDFPTTELAPA